MTTATDKRRRRGHESPSWRGGRIRTTGGYIMLKNPEHPNATPQGGVYEHVAVVSRALGRAVPLGAVAHHINNIRDDNRPGNLVLLEGPGEHTRLHMREKALAASGHAYWRKCGYCKAYDDPDNLCIRKSGDFAYHRACRRGHRKTRRLL